MKKNNKKFETNAVRSGTERSQFGEHSEGLFLTSSFVFKNAQEAARRFSGDDPGYVYSRFTNPSVNMFEERLAALEGAEQCIATSSGMSVGAASPCSSPAPPSPWPFRAPATPFSETTTVIPRPHRHRRSTSDVHGSTRARQCRWNGIARYPTTFTNETNFIHSVTLYRS